MLIIGLSGSIGMGKSTAAKMLRQLGLPLFDADATVHHVMAPGGPAVPLVAAAFPGVVKDGRIDRQKLGAAVFNDPPALRRLEGIIHPLVQRLQRRFLREAARRGERMVVLDIPLLFEGNGERRCDVTIVVSAPAFLQRQRVLARPGMTAAKFEGILRQQVPDIEKRRRATYVVPTGLGKAETRAHLRRIVGELRARQGRHWPPSPWRDRVTARLKRRR